MMQTSVKDLVGRTASLFSILFLFFNGSAWANKEGYYGKYIGKLSQLHHGVSGDVFAVDARTLHVRNFNYDGEGPAAYFYAGNSKAPGVNGFRLRDERGTTNVLPRYRNKHITITFPEGKSLQNVRWFSVWCDEFSVNFGDVKIPKNLDFPKPQKINGLAGVHGVFSEPIVIVDAQTLLIPSFSYDGEAPDAKFWVGRGLKPSPQGIRIPDENGKELPLRRYDRKTIVLTLPGELTIFDIGHFGVWCEAFTVDFGHVQIPRGLNIPPSLKMLGVSPQSKLNCEVLWDDFAYEVRWAVAGDSIVLQLVARLENNEYMSFGLSGDKKKSQMVGGDVIVAWVDKESLRGFAKDYYLEAKSQCSGGRGSCPDENIEMGASSVRLLNAALVNGYSIVTFQRSLKAQDDLDKDVITNASQPVIWAIGPLNSRKEVSYHSLTNRGDISINFGRPPKWNCPTPESVSDQSDTEDSVISREYEELRIQSEKTHDSNLRELRPKSQVPSPALAPKSAAWEIPPIKCYEPEDGVFYAQMGPTGGKHGYSAITGHVGWGISWYINGLLIPEINVVRGRTYTFIVEGGLDPETPARYHPFYITDDPIGGYQYKTPQERADIQIFAGAVQNKRGEVRPTGVGRLCNWTPDPNAPPADEFTSFGAYQRTLRLECDPGNPGIIQWTVEKDTPDTVYYQCYTHRYLGWKINVHNHCEGEAASHPQPSIINAPASVIKSSEGYSEGSESIKFEVRVKPDAEILKNILGKSQTNFGANELMSYKKHPSNFSGELKGSKNEFGIETAIINHQADSQNPFLHFQAPKISVILQQQKLDIAKPSLVLENEFIRFPVGTLPTNAPGYKVTEEPMEESLQPFIKSASNLQHNKILEQNDQHSHIGERDRKIREHLRSGNMFQKEYLKNLDILRAQVEENLPKNSHKLSYHNKTAIRLSARLKKPLPSNSVSLKQRPFPQGALRSSTFYPKLQKLPAALNSHRGVHLAQTKSPHFHQNVNIVFRPEDFNRQETQLLQQFKRPNHLQQNRFLGNYNLSGSSTVKESSSQNTFFVKNNGFNPQTVQVEGGFKPIINTGKVSILSSSLVDRADLEVTEEERDDGVGITDSITNKSFNERKSLVKERQKTYKDGKSGRKDNITEDKEMDLFKGQKPQTFEPIFIPSYPDESLKKYVEKYKNKSLLNLRPRQNPPLGFDFQNRDKIYLKIKPSANATLTSNNVVFPLKISQKGEAFHFRLPEPDNLVEKIFSGSDTITENSRAENILELLEMYEKKTETNGTDTRKNFISNSKFHTNDDIQDEVAMADEKNDFYLPPKADGFLSYDGKVVKMIEVPKLPKAKLATDVSKLPQFVPYKGAIPPLSLSVNAKTLPQLITSKLARSDILPPPNSDAETPTLRVSVLPQIQKIRERKERSADHILGHKEHDHFHHTLHSGGAYSTTISIKIGLISLALMGLQRFIYYEFLKSF